MYLDLIWLMKKIWTTYEIPERFGIEPIFWNWTFQFWSYEHQIFFGKCSNIFKTFVTGIFSYLLYKCRKSIFWTKLLFFQVLREIHFSIKMIDLVFTLKVTVTFVWWKIFWSIYGKFLLFANHIHLNVSNSFGMYLDAIWWSKNSKLF